MASKLLSQRIQLSRTAEAKEEKNQHDSQTPNKEISSTDTKTTKRSASSSKVAKKEETSSKKRKRSSPFRIKQGCVVAIRYRTGGNHVTLTEPYTPAPTLGTPFSEVWADPLPGRDEGLALIGRRVRCAFPKSVLTRYKGAKSRIVEGEVISIVDYETQSTRLRKRRRKQKLCATLVELLIDQDKLQSLPFLSRTDVVDFSKMTDAAKRGYKNEERIRGKNKAVVEVYLSDQFSATQPTADDDLLIARWVIRKRVPSKLPPRERLTDQILKKLQTDNMDINDSNNDTTKKDATNNNNINNNGKKKASSNNGNTDDEPPKKRRRPNSSKESAAPRYIGDGTDSPEQQEKNWRWLVSRYDYLHMLEEAPLSVDYLEYLSYGFVGEVMEIKPSSSSSSATLAMVTLKRLYLPEHTKSGRLSYHAPCDFYDDLDALMDAQNVTNQKEMLFQVPIEELIIISRKVQRHVSPSSPSVPKLVSESTCEEPIIRHLYSLRTDTFIPHLDSSPVKIIEACRERNPCHRCRHLMDPVLPSLSSTTMWLCDRCMEVTKKASRLRNENSIDIDSDEEIDDKDIICDCAECREMAETERQTELEEEVTEALATKVARNEIDNLEFSHGDAAFFATRAMLLSMGQVHFSLTPDFLDSVPSYGKPTTKLTQRGPKKPFKKNPGKKSADKASKEEISAEEAEEEEKRMQREEQRFQPTSSRLIPYNLSKRQFDATPKELFPWSRKSSSNSYSDKPRNLRLVTTLEDDYVEATKFEKEEKSNSRAARANQRRLMKGAATIGYSFDTLAGRESQLRFDRSGIHAWGVFADEDIKEGEMIIEYRGEIIGNAVAEKREIEYEAAKIGSDYMFRIDSLVVCDATKQGNVARFINACCDPNCYTKIISIDGTKRIVVYAKKDIKAGDELCYDYKFPLEYDESKRIPCHCGARDCRGFLNWDKRYVAIPEKKISNKNNKNDSEHGQRSLKQAGE